MAAHRKEKKEEVGANMENASMNEPCFHRVTRFCVCIITCFDCLEPENNRFKSKLGRVCFYVKIYRVVFILKYTKGKLLLLIEFIVKFQLKNRS